MQARVVANSFQRSSMTRTWLEDEGANDSGATAMGTEPEQIVAAPVAELALRRAKDEGDFVVARALYRFVARDGVYTEVYRGSCCAACPALG